MPIQIYILSKLLEGNTYPYQLKKQLSDPIPFDQIGKLTESKLYYHFDSLTKAGLIESVEIIKEEHRPDKQVFAITEKGREMLPQKIYKLLEKGENVKDFVIGLFFLEFVDKNKVIRILQAKLEDIKSKKKLFQVLSEQVQLADKYVPTIIITNEYMLSRLDIEIQTIKKVIEQLESEV